MRTRDPAKISKIQAAYYIRHRDRILARNAKWRAANLDSVNKQKRDHTEAKKKAPRPGCGGSGDSDGPSP